jgi:hypothetical protein
MNEKNNFNPERSSMLEKEESEKFQLLYDKPQIQYLISNLARGPINIAQVVKKGDKYFSHHQKFDNLESKKDIKTEFESDMLILNYVFYDNDHSYYKRHINDEEINEHKNLIINKEENKGYIFDLDLALYTDFRENIDTKIGRENTVKSITAAINNNAVLAKNLFEKTNQLLEFNFKDKKFFDSVILKTEVDLSSNEFSEYFKFMNSKSKDNNILGNILFNDIVSRLRIIKDVVDDYIICSTKEKTILSKENS